MWFWPVLILVLVILFVWWLLMRQAEKTETPTHHVAHEHTGSGESSEEPVAARTAEIEIEAPAEEEIPGQEDNLEIIEGIGPKISSVLKAGGIKTFAQLADADVEKVREILTSSDPRLGRISDPTTWGEQSRLAADGKMEELKVLQDNLKGGRTE